MAATKRRKRVQVGWYCNHEDEKRTPPYDGSHLSNHGKWRKKEWVDTFPEPNVTKGLTFLDYRDPTKPPHCPKAVPTYIYTDAEEATS